MKQTKLFFLFTALCLFWLNTNLRAQAVGDYGSAASGNWGTAATWVVCVTPGTWDGATAAASLPSSATTISFWIRSGHTVIMEASTKYCNNLTIENGGKLWCNSANTSPRYLRISGTTITNNGIFGGPADAISIYPLGTNLTFTGSGTYGMSRIQPQVDGLTLVFDADALVTYAGSSGTGSSAIYNNGKDNLTITVNAGKTLTTGPLAYITLGTSGSNPPSTGLNITLNINGTLTTGTDGHINLLNASNKTSTINIGSTGVLNSNGNLLMPDGTTSTGIFNIVNGGLVNTLSAKATTLGTSTLTTLAGQLNASGPVNVNGRFQINSGGWAYGSGVWKYGPTATLEFNTNAFYGVNSDAVFWPVTDGPVNINILQGGLLLNTARTVTGIFQTSAGVKNTFGNNLTVLGTVKLNTGGYFDNFSPTYTNTSTLEYNTGGNYGTYNEWIEGATVGYGVPQNVTLSNSTTVDLSGNRTVMGNLSLSSGDMNTNGKTLILAGTTSGSGSILTGTTGMVSYDGTAPQAISNLKDNTVNQLAINNLAGVSLSTPTTAGSLLLVSGDLFLGANDLTLLNPSGLLQIHPVPSMSYIVTDGIGKIIKMVIPGPVNLIPVGASATSYDPVNLSPAAPALFSVNVSTTLPADAPAQYTYAPKVWDISVVAGPPPPSTTVTLTPSNPVATVTSDVIGHYTGGAYTNETATRSGNDYTATFTSFSPFVTGTYDIGTSVSRTVIDGISFDGRTVYNPANISLQVFDAAGRLTVSSTKNINMSSYPKGIYIVRNPQGSQKIALMK